jgi:hypothetical protein
VIRKFDAVGLFESLYLVGLLDFVAERAEVVIFFLILKVFEAHGLESFLDAAEHVLMHHFEDLHNGVGNF